MGIRAELGWLDTARRGGLRNKDSTFLFGNYLWGGWGGEVSEGGLLPPQGKSKICVNRRAKEERMHLFFRDKWEVEGLQTVGILLVVCSSLKLMHFLGLIDISVAGKGSV